MLQRLQARPTIRVIKPRFASEPTPPQAPESPFTPANKFLPDPALHLKNILDMHTQGFRAKFQTVLDSAQKHLKGLLKTVPAAKLAVVMDLDETLLDNSAYNLAKLLKQKPKEYNYFDWVKSGQCPAIPESLKFAQWVIRNKMPLFFVTSRVESMRTGTMDNLRKVGIPASKYTLYTKPDDMLGKKGTSNAYKVGVQNELVRQGFTIGAIIGDQQSDIDNTPGTGFLLPNSMYTSD